MSAGEQLRLGTMRTQHRHRFVGGSGPHVVELGGDHADTPFAVWIASQTCWGDAGIVTSRTPNVDKASTTAFITAGVAAIVPASPMPFTPIGFVGLGVTVSASSKFGNSAADGTR